MIKLLNWFLDFVTLVFVMIFQTAKLDELDGVKRKVAACTLDKATQDLVKLIFDNDMFKEAMETFHIG